MISFDFDEFNGIRILAELGAMKLSAMLSLKVDEALLKRFEFILLQGINEYDVAKAEEEALNSPEASAAEGGRRLKALYECCKSDVTLTLLELIMLKVSVPQVSELFELIEPGNKEGVTLLTAARVSGYTGSVDDLILPMREAEESAAFLLDVSPSEEDCFYRNVYYADAYLLSFLCSAPLRDSGFEEFSDRFGSTDNEPVIYGMKSCMDGLLRSMKKLLSDKERRTFCVLISGEKESGRYTLLKAVSKKTGLDLFTVDFDYLINEKEPKEAIRRIIRICALENRALCIRNIEKKEDTVFLTERLFMHYRQHCILPLILITDTKVKLAPVLSERFISVKMPDNSSQAPALWKGFLPKEYRQLADSLSSKMKMNAGQIKKVCSSLEAVLSSGIKADEHTIIRLCYDILDDGRYDNVKWVKPGFDLEDLKIDPHNRAILDNIIDQVEHRFTVYDDWNLKEKYAYGRCVSVILAGPPGTGKTMTVHALASRLGLELYKVDLSQITDKYVGETEKRLEEVFARAEKCNMILFFDEADAVMGKRSEVKDAQDKYANTEISFILQRLEEYDGIVILATNNMQNIDTAFMRRIRYVLNFERPDETARKEIWLSVLSGDVPLDNDIDFDYLAKQFEFSGGEIKNVVLNAVFYGAADERKVGMKHIMKAVFRELTKTRRVTLNEDYGKYGYLMKD